MSFSISATLHFSASHQLRLYDGSLESLHGHNWVVRVTVGAAELDSIGVVMDFHELERLMEGVVGGMRNRHLNELDLFGRRNPSAENVAVVVAERLSLPKGVKLETVEVWETAENSAIYRA